MLIVVLTKGRGKKTTEIVCGFFLYPIDWQCIRYVFFRDDGRWRPAFRGYYLSLLLSPPCTYGWYGRIIELRGTVRCLSRRTTMTGAVCGCAGLSSPLGESAALS